MFNFLMHGPLMEEVGGVGGAGGGGTAVAETGGDFATAPDTGTGTEVHDAEFVDTGTGTPSEPGTSLVKAGERAVQNGRFTQSGRAAIESLRTLSPKLAQEFTQAVLTRDWFLKEFPGGKREIAQLRELAKSSGGEQGIGELRTTAEFFNNLDELFTNSDPRFVEEITTSEAEQRAFAGLMLPILNKLDNLAPKQMAHYQANGFKRVMDGAGVPTMFATQSAILNRAGKAFGEGNHQLAASFLAEIIDNHNTILDFIDGIYRLAKSDFPALNSASDPKLDDRAKQLSAKEKELQQTEWSMAVSNERRRVFSKAWTDLTKGRSLTKDQEDTAKGFYELRLNAKIKQWSNQAERFIANGDKDGYLREQFTFFQRAIPDSLRAAIPVKPGPKPSSGPLKPPISRGTPTHAGVIRVAKMPPTSQLDAIRTTSAMMAENRAYGKDGRLYQWT